ISPKRARQGAVRRISGGLRMQAGEDARGWYIRLAGTGVDRELVERAMEELERLLERPEG
ncbi:chromosome partitioning protein ParB, partial [Rhodovulum sulfidophilum]|nr:chromosome partitioning protein ParB [Rhodovulum sulfidophilum]